jgi:hypothetical protein
MRGEEHVECEGVSHWRVANSISWNVALTFSHQESTPLVEVIETY